MIKHDYERMSEVWDKHNVFDLMVEKYSKEIESEYLWNNILNELNNPDEDMIVDDDFNDIKYASLYIGSVLSIMPSGKFYMPFACSNINNVREALLDECYREAFELKCGSLELWLENGEGDPTDMFICKTID